jgi:hypothetical protein
MRRQQTACFIRMQELDRSLRQSIHNSIGILIRDALHWETCCTGALRIYTGRQHRVEVGQTIACTRDKLVMQSF